ncbi:MAG: hypothetical protein U5J78_03460, partial [Parasphingorhabdus sp.]|nr:hypothetical protein [Parasphingorhabdus sp.]
RIAAIEAAAGRAARSTKRRRSLRSLVLDRDASARCARAAQAARSGSSLRILAEPSHPLGQAMAGGLRDHGLP